MVQERPSYNRSLPIPNGPPLVWMDNELTPIKMRREISLTKRDDNIENKYGLAWQNLV